jgi:hypothetical protein
VFSLPGVPVCVFYDLSLSLSLSLSLCFCRCRRRVVILLPESYDPLP